MFPASSGLHGAGQPGVLAPAPPSRAARTRHANGSRTQLAGGDEGASRAKPNITGGAYDPTDIYNSQAYDYNALYSQSHCCNPLGNSGDSPAATSIAIATFGYARPL